MECLKEREPHLWRYREILPVERDENVVTLGEGFTPLVRIATGRAAWVERALHQGRGAEPNAEFQGARYDGGGFHGERVGRAEAGGAVGRQRGGGVGGVRGPRGVGSAHFHALRHAARQCDRVRANRRSGDFDGWTDYRLWRRSRTTERSRRLV